MTSPMTPTEQDKELHARRRRSEKPPRKEMLRAIQEEKDK